MILIEGGPPNTLDYHIDGSVEFFSRDEEPELWAQYDRKCGLAERWNARRDRQAAGQGGRP